MIKLPSKRLYHCKFQLAMFKSFVFPKRLSILHTFLIHLIGINSISSFKFVFLPFLGKQNIFYVYQPGGFPYCFICAHSILVICKSSLHPHDPPHLHILHIFPPIDHCENELEVKTRGRDTFKRLYSGLMRDDGLDQGMGNHMGVQTWGEGRRGRDPDRQYRSEKIY